MHDSARHATGRTAAAAAPTRGRWAPGLLLVGIACAPGGDATEPVGAPEMRAALFDTILARTERREAFSPVKNTALGFDPLAEMAALRDDVVGAESEEALFQALRRLSAARRDRHLSVARVPGGLEPAFPGGLDAWGGLEEVPALQAPVRLRPDYGGAGGYFVADVAEGAEGPQVGDRIVSVHGRPPAEVVAAMEPYVRHSTGIGLRWKLAAALSQRTGILPEPLRPETLVLEVEGPDGQRRSWTLPYLDPGGVAWRGASEPAYAGFSRVRATPTWDLHLPDDGRPVVIVVWYGFRETMVEDVDTLVALAEREGLLDHALLVDVTRSRGGSRGPYALQRLQPRPFKTTFGNLRISDVVAPFIEERRAAFAERAVLDAGVPETVDDGRWLMEWLEGDVTAALERGDAYTANEPFKTAHAPAGSDGVLQPAPVHFRGPFVVISGPQGGSHLDQFNAIVKDNGLGAIVGMPAGGYSNTWEWEETLTFPGTGRPVVGFMYSIGHTIRPNGEVLEGNPAAVDDWVPLTAANTEHYYALLFERAMVHVRAALMDRP